MLGPQSSRSLCRPFLEMDDFSQNISVLIHRRSLRICGYVLMCLVLLNPFVLTSFPLIISRSLFGISLPLGTLETVF